MQEAFRQPEDTSQVAKEEKLIAGLPGDEKRKLTDLFSDKKSLNEIIKEYQGAYNSANESGDRGHTGRY